MDGIVAALVSHAQRLPASSRQEFLDIFSRPGIRPPVLPDDQLLADIDDFSRRVRDGQFDGSRDRYDDWRDDPYDDDYPSDDDYRSDDEWVPEADALFAMTAEAFLADRLEVAREAYCRLFPLFRPVHQEGGGLESWMLETTDVTEAAARYLRCVYETSPLRQRGLIMYREYIVLHPSLSGRLPLLRDIVATRRGDLPCLDVFLPAWIDTLLTKPATPPAGHRRRLVTEAALLQSGLDGLADLARRPGPHQPGTYLDLIDALTEAGEVSLAADAARKALTLAPVAPGALAQAADRLAELSTRLGDPTGAVEARRRAWRVAPTRERLLALAASAQAAGTRDEILAAEASYARTSTDRLACELFLLAGQLDVAAAALTHAQPRGWSRSDHPGPVVLPYLLVAATAAPPPAADTQLGHLFAAMDDIPAAPNHYDPEFGGGGWALDTTEEELPGHNASGRSGAGSLAALLTSQITAAPAPAHRRQQWLATAATVVERRIEAIVGNKHRSAYARAASLTVAYAEALIITGVGDGNAYIASMRQRYPRHTAFRAELDDATYSSALARQDL